MSRKTNDWIKSFLKYTDNSEPPEMYRMWTAISVIAAVLQRKCYLNWGEITFFPNMYVVLVGPSGRCRKGTAMGVGSKFLRELGIKMASEAITREALIRELAGTETMDVDPDTNRQYFHSSLTVFAQELTVFLGYNNLTLISDLTDWYDCRDEWTYRTKGMGTDNINGVWVNLIGATTPDLVRSALPQDAVGGGLSSRIVFVFEENKGKIVAAPFLSTEDQALRKDLLDDLEKIHMLRGEFSVTEQFIEKWIEWYTYEDSHPPFQGDERFDGYTNRRPNHVMKLSMIICAAQSDEMVMTKSHLEQAIKILERTELKMPYTFTGYGLAENADVTARIMALIKKAGDKGMSKNHIFKLQQHNITSSQQLTDIITKLQMIGFCKYKIDTGMIYYINSFEDKYQ